MTNLFDANYVSNLIESLPVPSEYVDLWTESSILIRHPSGEEDGYSINIAKVTPADLPEMVLTLYARVRVQAFINTHSELLDHPNEADAISAILEGFYLPILLESLEEAS